MPLDDLDDPCERQFLDYQVAVHFVGEIADEDHTEWVSMTKADDENDVRIYWTEGVFDDLSPAAEYLLIAEGVIEEGFIE